MRGMGNMNNLIKQAQKMQKKIAAAQEELLTKKVEGSAGGGMVIVEVDGSKQITNITIKPEVVDPEDIEMLQDLVIAATNDALKNMAELEAKTMGPLTQGMNMPGMF